MPDNISVQDNVDLVLLSLGVLAQLILCIWWIVNVYCICTIQQSHQNNNGQTMSPSRSTSPRSTSPKSISNLQSKTSTNDSNIETNTDIEQNMYNYTQNKRKKQNAEQIQAFPSIFKILTSLSLFFGLMTLVTMDIYHILRLFKGYTGTCMIHQIPIIFCLIQRLTLFLCYIYRIEIVFKDSAFSISKTRLNILRIVYVCVGVMATMFHFAFIKLNGCVGLSVLIGLIPAGINDIFISIATFVLFVSRLKKVMKMSKSGSNSKVKQIIQKLTILVSVTLFSTIGGMMLFVIVPQVGLFAADMVINCLCLLLSYTFFSKYYNRLCFLCVKCVENISNAEEPDKSNNSDISPQTLECT